MNCAFIGFGNAACGMIKGLREAGLETVYFHKHRDRPPFSGLLARRVAETGAIWKPDYAGLLAASRTVISCVVGAAALKVAGLAAPHLTPEHLYVDLNTASPAVKQAVAGIIGGTGARFADGAILGPVEALRQRTPILACGDGARLFQERLSPYGMDIAVLEGGPGRAAAVKLLRSVFQKGLMCLLTEMLLAARSCGVEEEVLASVEKTFDGVPLRDMAGRIVPKAAVGAGRMVREMEDVRDALAEQGLPAFMAEAALRTLARNRDLRVPPGPGGAPSLAQTLDRLMPSRPGEPRASEQREGTQHQDQHGNGDD